MNQLKIATFGMLFVLVCHAIALAAPTAKVTAEIVDETGTPVEEADVRVAYQVTRERGKIGLKGVAITGKSDQDGLFSASNEDGVPQVTVSACKDGYYRSSKIVKFTSESRFPSRWEPWNPTVEVALKKKRNPVAMYAKKTDVIIVPVVGKPVGFDLEKGDWVTPYGKGLVNDFLFTFKIDLRAYRDYEGSLRLTFSNEKDGMQEYYSAEGEQSYYKWPFQAPSDGYMKKLRKEKSDTPEGGIVTNMKRNTDYIFRVRTKIDDEGNIIEAKYGKISGEIEFGRKGQIQFSYYFNPSGTRNLEFDPEQNLVKWSSRRDEQKHRIKSP